MSDRIRQLLANPTPIDPAQFDPEFVQVLDETISEMVRSGYWAVDEIVEAALETATEEEVSEEMQAYAEACLAQTIAQVAAEQTSWPARTDYDKLVAAFTELETQGVACRENFSCCGNCGSGEILDEMEAMEGEGKQVIGYVFFHMQDTDAAVGGHGLYFNYGTQPEKSEADAVAIGQRLVDALKAQGLEAQWNGTLAKRVGLKLNWQRRLDEDFMALLPAGATA